MKDAVSKIKDISIIAGIYLFFMSWVYVHFYYQQFGLSTSELKLGYTDYLVYSYDVIITTQFIWWFVGVGAGVITWHYLQEKLSWFPKVTLPLLLFGMFIVFPVLFKVSRDAALHNAKDDREHLARFRQVKFMFKGSDNLLCPAKCLDSACYNKTEFTKDLLALRDDTASADPLFLLGESDDYFIVLNQKPLWDGMLPVGYVYFIRKEDVLFNKVILSTQ